MENYYRRPKTTQSKFENDGETIASIPGSSHSKLTSQQHNKPQQHGVMVISSNGKIRTYVTRALEVLNEADNDAAISSDTEAAGTQEGSSVKETSKTAASSKLSGSIPPSSAPVPSLASLSSTRGVLTIKAQGRSITKAVTVAEILKRRMEGTLHQFTEIGQITEQEIWDPTPDKPSLDPLTVSRHRPTIRIRLSKHLDTNTGYTAGGTALKGVDPSMPGASIPRDEHTDDLDEGEEGGQGESWPGAILDRDTAARRFVGYQAPTGNDIYL
ncbi:hypothetical protein EDD11_000025 [Mortierella claussenii]|nr:hypothetical protein EDD11_000025 [Mortierella claussenii]